MRYKIQGVYRDEYGNVVPNGTVSVYLSGTTTPANIYTAATGGSPVASVLTGSDGWFTFYYIEGDYYAERTRKVVLSKVGYTPRTYDYVKPNAFYVGARTKATLLESLVEMGATEPATLFVRPGVWTIDESVDWAADYPNVTIKFAPGAKFSYSSYSPKLPTVEAGAHKIFIGTTGAVTIKEALPHLTEDWWYNDSGDYAPAINAAVASMKQTAIYAPDFVLKAKAYPLASAIVLENRIGLLGKGPGATILQPAAGINGVEVNYGAGITTDFMKLGNFSISGGKNGIKFGGGYYIQHADIHHIDVSGHTEAGLLVDDTDIQSSTIRQLRVTGGERGAYIKGVTSANRNTWANCDFTGTTEAGLELEGTDVTYAHTGPVMLNVVTENNYKHGMILRNVRDAAFIGYHAEGNGRTLTGGPYANILLYGNAAYPTETLTFIGSTNVATGPNQGGLILQVANRYVRGPIHFINCQNRAADIVDLGTGLNSGVLEYTAFVNEGMLPITVQGDTAQVSNTHQNIIINGSFEQWTGGTGVIPDGWGINGAGATFAQVAGTYSAYACRFTGLGAGHNLRQLSMTPRLKPNTLYHVRAKYSMDAASTSGFSVNFINNGTPAVLWSEATTIGGDGWITHRTLMRTPSTISGATTGFYFNQLAAGTVILDIDEFEVNEGIEGLNNTPNVQDFARATSAETITGTDLVKAVTPAGLAARLAAAQSAILVTGGKINGTSIGLKEDTLTDGATLTVAQCTGLNLHNYGQAAAITVTLPAAAAELNFVITVCTKYNAALKIQRAGSDTMIVDGAASKTYFTSTNQEVGSAISCRAIKTGASAYTWLCTTISGTWTTD
jgi:hypothetical protein